jgi:uncharacterized protein (DUF1800 family)
MRHQTGQKQHKPKATKKKAKAKKGHGKLRHKLSRRHRLKRPPARKRGAATVDVKSMSAAMVDRLFWRAGFGPTADDRARWAGKPLADAVAWLLDTPGGLAGNAGTRDGKPLDPTGDDTDLVLTWVDRMVRSTNPFVERLTFFWHRHWANSRDQVSPPQLLLTQNELFRRYADFGANRGATFRDMAYEVSEDPAMLRFLTGESNVRGAPNENYARELMELFGLGVSDAGGRPNYSEDDVKQMAKALSGWQIDDADPDAARSYFTPSRWYNGPKVVFGKLGNYKDRDAVDLVLGHGAHAPFLVSKLWGEFHSAALDDGTRAALVAAYASNGFQLRPLLEKILTDPRLFDSIDEPNLIKPPIVYAVGAMRALGAGVADAAAAEHLDSMGQVPYFPPTVAGWEGGLSWLNTNTALARFAFVAALVGKATIDDVKGETPVAAVSRAHAAAGTPWLADGTKAALRDYATRAASSTPAARRERQLVLRTLILAGPDAQVM